MNSIKPFSPVNHQDLIWVAKYLDGSHLAEYDFMTRKANLFASINKNNLIRFGLVGHGMRFFFEVFGGIFNVNGQVVDFVYKTKDRDYFLTGQDQMYKDIITYKDSEAVLYQNGGVQDSGILQYNVGYKTVIPFPDVTFNFKPIFHIPNSRPANFSVRLVANQNLNGDLIIRKNQKEVASFHAPIEKNVGGELQWVFK